MLCTNIVYLRNIKEMIILQIRHAIPKKRGWTRTLLMLNNPKYITQKMQELNSIINDEVCNITFILSNGLEIKK